MSDHVLACYTLANSVDITGNMSQFVGFLYLNNLNRNTPLTY